MTELNYKFSTREAYLKALDSVMPDNYIQKRDLGGGKVSKYLPAPIKEAIADDFFIYWNVVDEKYQLIANELICTVKLVFLPSYPGSDELFCTGTAAVPVQMDAGAKIIDFPAKKKTNALEYNVPGVRTEAMSKALETLGNIFGRNISRKINKNTDLPNNFKIRNHGQSN